MLERKSPFRMHNFYDSFDESETWNVIRQWNFRGKLQGFRNRNKGNQKEAKAEQYFKSFIVDLFSIPPIYRIPKDFQVNVQHV